MHAPEFWYRPAGALTAALAPAAWVYDRVASWRARGTGWRAPVPVICCGNLTVGGAGKTPLALAIAARLIARGRRVAFLTRGYRGSLAGPVTVDRALHSAAQVGDEPLLLAELAATVVARDRAQGARHAIAAGADTIIMDDGLQNPSLAKDLCLVAIDGARGFGNGRVLPAGPLREALARGLARADALVMIGEDAHGLTAALAPKAPVLRAELMPDSSMLALAGRRVVAFAGIGRPEKFFASLRAAGAELVETRDFADHHEYRANELASLNELATRCGANLVTTAKDHVRLPSELRQAVARADAVLQFADDAAVDALLGRIGGPT
jgi:tetraacyldisaccharide 4'-kinase